MTVEQLKQAERTAQTAANCRALNHLFSERDRAREERDAAELRISRFDETIQVLIDALPEKERAEYERRFEELRLGPQPKGGEVFGNVIQLFRNNPLKPWTVQELQAELCKTGPQPDAKSIYNTIGYLAKTGKLTRIARGQYMIADIGAGLEIEGLERGTSRTTEHDY